MYMMTLKKGEGHDVDLPLCTHYEIKTVTEESAAASDEEIGAEPGIRVELRPSGDVVHLPRDGNELFVMFADGPKCGKTARRLVWPPEPPGPKAKEFRR